MKFQDYYEVLGVKRDASAEDIKKAYHKLALKWHPDRHQGATRSEAEERFKQINEAKEVLLDPEKRRKYDQFGQNWQHGQEFTPPGGARQMSPEEFSRMFGGAGFSDFFASMFGEDMFGGFSRQRTRKRRFGSRGADVNAELKLSVGDAIAGGKRTFTLDAIAACPTCGGEGVIEDDHVCPTCAGLGRMRTKKTVELAIPKSPQDGMKLRLKGLGEAGDSGGPSGDLYLTLTLESDEVYRRVGNDIEADLPVAPWEALEGAKVQLKTLDGTATLSVPPNTQSGAKLRMRGLGLSDERDNRGDFYAIVRLALPENLSERQRELVKQLPGAGPAEVTGGARV